MNSKTDPQPLGKNVARNPSGGTLAIQMLLPGLCIALLYLQAPLPLPAAPKQSINFLLLILAFASVINQIAKATRYAKTRNFFPCLLLLSALTFEFSLAYNVMSGYRSVMEEFNARQGIRSKNIHQRPGTKPIQSDIRAKSPKLANHGMKTESAE
jgi:hypothetical protein